MTKPEVIPIAILSRRILTGTKYVVLITTKNIKIPNTEMTNTITEAINKARNKALSITKTDRFSGKASGMVYPASTFK
jgi:hypothetical protein